MNILLFGSSGFIGKKVAAILSAQNHNLITPNSREINFTHPYDLDVEKTEDLMQNVDVVINMVGIMSNDKMLMENVHHYTPARLARIAKAQDVPKWVNLSALGAEPTHDVAFVGSKGRGDDTLLDLADNDFTVKVARPSLVFGRGGASTELFLKMAKMPILVLPNGGNFNIQPVHVDDVALGLVKLATENHDLPNIINFTGKKVVTLADYVSQLRAQILNQGEPKIISIQTGLAKFSASILASFSNMVNSDSLTLLEQGNTADNTTFGQLLGKPPQSLHLP